jgi:hypothetical protein
VTERTTCPICGSLPRAKPYFRGADWRVLRRATCRFGWVAVPDVMIVGWALMRAGGPASAATRILPDAIGNRPIRRNTGADLLAVARKTV